MAYLSRNPASTFGKLRYPEQPHSKGSADLIYAQASFIYCH
jgi:hypothetical protein